MGAGEDDADDAASHALVVPASQHLASLQATMDAARNYVGTAKAARTRIEYGKDWRAFVAFCGRYGLTALPATGATVALYCADRAQAGHKYASIVRYLSSITEAHRVAGHPSVRRSGEVVLTMQGIRRQHGVAQRKAQPLSPEMLRTMVRPLDLGVARDLRDRAALLLGFAGALRRSEIVGLDIKRVEYVEKGICLHIPYSKANQEGLPEEVCIPHQEDSEFCAVAALHAWLRLSNVVVGDVFRSVDKRLIKSYAMCGGQVSRVLKARAEAVGIDPEPLSGHSLRAGFITAAYAAGVPEFEIMRHTRHKSLQEFRGYIRMKDAFINNPLTRIKL